MVTQQEKPVYREAYIDKKELCQLLGLCARTVERYQRRGLIPVIKPGKTCRYRWSEVQAAMTTHPFKKNPAARLPQDSKNKKQTG